MACHSENLRTSSRLRSIWTVTISSGATDRFRQCYVFARRSSTRLPQLGSRIGCSVLGSAPFSARSSLACARKMKPFMATTHTVHCVVAKLVPCFLELSSNVNCARLERLTYDLEKYRPENIFQLLNDNSTPVFHCERTRGCCGDNGIAQRNGISTHILGPQTNNNFVLYLWRLTRAFKTGLTKTLSDKLHQHRHGNINQRCHNSTGRIYTESFLRVA